MLARLLSYLEAYFDGCCTRSLNSHFLMYFLRSHIYAILIYFDASEFPRFYNQSKYLAHSTSRERSTIAPRVHFGECGQRAAPDLGRGPLPSTLAPTRRCAPALLRPQSHGYSTCRRIVTHHRTRSEPPRPAELTMSCSMLSGEPLAVALASCLLKTDHFQVLGEL